jgi:hypothetical protein
MKTYFLTYADDRFGYRGGVFRERQKVLSEAALKHGADVVIAQTRDDLIQTEFYREHRALLDKNHFHTGWGFKPVMILSALKKIQMGDILFYHDCNSHPLQTSMKPLVDLCVRNQGTVFMQWGDQNRNWVKRDAFVYMGCDTPAYHNAVSLQATWMLIQKREWTLQLVREWLAYNLDERIASVVKPDTCGLPQLPGFVENRGDQAILSVLAAKFGIRTFFGHGAGANKNVNNFMQTIPRNALEQVYWRAVEIRRKLRRKKYVANYLRQGKANYLKGDISKKWRDECYWTADASTDASHA